MAKPTRYTEDMIDEYLAKGFWTQETTADLWDACAKSFGDDEALVDSRKRLSWKQIKQRSDKLAMNLLDLGFQAGEPIFLLVPNCVESYIVRIACEKAGILCLTALASIREREIQHILRHYGVKGIVVQPEFRGFEYYQSISKMMPGLPKLDYLFCIGDDVPPNSISIEEMCHKPADGSHKPEETRFTVGDVAIIALTSGTTGMPKVAEHPVGARIALGESYHRKLDLKKEDIIFNAINAVAGLGAPVCYSNVREGAKTVTMEIWNAKKALEIIEKERPTIFVTTPAQMTMLIKESDFDDYDTSSLRAVYCGTSPLSYEMAIAGEEKLNAPILNAYGSFDGGGISGTAVDDSIETRLFSAGKPHRGNEVRIVDGNGNQVATGEEGEITFRGPCSCSGYYKDMEKTVEKWGTLGMDGWFHTGDLGKLDEENNITLTGRKKEVIIRGGHNIYPQEIEGLLFMHPRVKHAAVVAMPDPIMGEKACAFVVTNDGEPFTFNEMKAFLLEKQIAKYKLPERLEVRASIPLRDEQKVAKSLLVEELERMLKREGAI